MKMILNCLSNLIFWLGGALTQASYPLCENETICVDFDTI